MSKSKTESQAKSTGAKPKTFRKIFDFFDAPVVDIDCGQMCKHLNDGSPVCCDTDNAIPIVQKAEWKALKKRTDMWSAYEPRCAFRFAISLAAQAFSAEGDITSKASPWVKL